MIIPSRRQLTEAEKADMIAKHRNADGFVRCFIDNNIIENEKDIQFDHIVPWANIKNEAYKDNMAPVCRKHNLAKKDMTLSEYRDKLHMESLFSKFESDGRQLKLNDVLAAKYNSNFGFSIEYNLDKPSKRIKIKYFQDKDKIKIPIEEIYPVFQCPITKMEYFYAQAPSKNVLNDGIEGSELELQPRPLIFPHLWDLYRHLRVNTQLQPSIGRIDNNDGKTIFIFDGQHKAAARIWAGEEKIELKIYIEPEKIKLIRTNIIAHDKLKQLKFYSSILADVMGKLYGVNWQRYVESSSEKSEKGFCNFIKYAENKNDDKPEKQIESFLITSILKDEDNRFFRFVAPETKTGKQYAISWDSLGKYYFRYFLAKPPLNVEIDSKDDYRNQEIKNNIKVSNILAEEILIDKWNPMESNEQHKKAERIFRPGSIKVWLPMLREVIFNRLGIWNPDEARYLLFRSISEEKWTNIENYIKRMFSHQIWLEKDPNIDVVLGNQNMELTKELFFQKGFTTQWILGIGSIYP